MSTARHGMGMLSKWRPNSLLTKLLATVVVLPFSLVREAPKPPTASPFQGRFAVRLERAGARRRAPAAAAGARVALGRASRASTPGAFGSE